MAEIDKILDLLQQAVDYRRAEKYEESKKYLEELLTLQPDYPPALNEMGLVFDYLGDFEKAISYFKKRLDIEPNNTITLNCLGGVYQDKGQFEKAIEYYQRAIELEPGNIYVLDELGLTYEKKGDKNKAYECFKKISKLACEDLTDKLRDKINRLQELQKKLKEKETQLMEASRVETVGAMATSFAHQVNNPLHVIQAILFKLNRKKHIEESALRKDLLTIEKHTERINELIEYFNKLVKQESEDWEDININEVISDVFELFEEQLKNRNIRVELKRSKEDAPPPVVCGNRVKLEQVFINLLVNARDALESVETPEIKVKLTLPNEKQIMIYFSDNGHGISEENQQRLFQEAFTTKKHGTGLGLWLCENIIHQMGGKLKVESKPDNGTTFIIYLPGKIRGKCYEKS